ncbi:MAG TPA: hypothetical protein VJX67_18415 [Blastocatellia bacterium]|nr:hypothetical protein [Blastocatellia bacterium]
MRCPNCYIEIVAQTENCQSCYFPLSNVKAGAAKSVAALNGEAGAGVEHETANANAPASSEPQQTNGSVPASGGSPGHSLASGPRADGSPNYTRRAGARTDGGPNYARTGGLSKGSTSSLAKGGPARPGSRTTAALRNQKKAQEDRRAALFNRLRPIAYSVIAAGLVFYVVWQMGLLSRTIDSQKIIPTQNSLRNLPSNESGLTVDAFMHRELDRSRASGQLVRYQGWTAQPVQGNTSKLIVSFSFEEKDGNKQVAQWVADLSNNTFTPKTDLAARAYGKPSN